MPGDGDPAWPSHLAAPGSDLVTILRHNLQLHLLPGEGLRPGPGSRCAGAWPIPRWQDAGIRLQAEQTWGQNGRVLTERGGKPSPH